jgi:CubicO group peptidase (beta-lactamase class C family)
MILGLLVQTVSQEPYEVYLQRHIFQPLDMWHSYTSEDQARRAGMATGYRYWFGFPVAFDASYFRDQIPAGFIISTAEDENRSSITLSASPGYRPGRYTGTGKAPRRG